MGFVTIKDQDGVEHTIHASQLPVSNQTLTVTYGCSECDKLRADLAAAQRELAAYKDAVAEVLLECCDLEIDAPVLQERIECHATLLLSELLAQEGVPAQPQYREPTLEDALELIRASAERAPIEQLGTVRNSVLQALKQLGFVRKVQP